MNTKPNVDKDDIVKIDTILLVALNNQNGCSWESFALEFSMPFSNRKEEFLVISKFFQLITYIEMYSLADVERLRPNYPIVYANSITKKVLSNNGFKSVLKQEKP